MIREFKHIFEISSCGGIDISSTNRNNGGDWEEIISFAPCFMDLNDCMALDAELMTHFGWTLYDNEDNNIISGWKEFSDRKI